MNTDRIEKTVLLRVPRTRIWRALSNVDEFGKWFGVKLDGTFEPGTRLHGKITHKGYEHVPFEIIVDRVEPERVLSWRWHPNAVDIKTDYEDEPTTLVTFQLQDMPTGTRLDIVESGFDAIPEARRQQAYDGNEKGWTMQVESITRHLQQAA